MKETAINWDNKSKEVMISTSEYNTKNKLDKLCEEFPNVYKLESQSGDYNNYRVKEKKFIRFAKPRVLSPEQLERLRNNFRTSK